MNKSRIEAFSDGVFAIIITIMVLEIKVPHDASWTALLGIWPVFLSYLLSFLFVGVYWNNHHHLLQAAKHTTGAMMIANLNQLFWLSLMPFATDWMGENHFAPNTVAVYSIVLALCGFAFSILQVTVSRAAINAQQLKEALRKQRWKELSSTVCALAAIPCAYIQPAISGVLILLLVLPWLLPDTNIERAIRREAPAEHR